MCPFSLRKLLLRVRGAGQYITFDSTHIWETGIQTYIAGVQHLHTVPDPQCNLGTSALSDDPTFKVYGAPELIDKICTAQHSNQQASATTHPPIVSTVDLSNQPAHSSSAQEDRTPAEQRVPRRLLLILALREDTWLTNYISALTEPELWQVHAWQTGDALTRPTARSVTHAVMTIATEGGREPHFYTTAAGVCFPCFRICNSCSKG